MSQSVVLEDRLRQDHGLREIVVPGELRLLRIDLAKALRIPPPDLSARPGFHRKPERVSHRETQERAPISIERGHHADDSNTGPRRRTGEVPMTRLDSLWFAAAILVPL